MKGIIWKELRQWRLLVLLLLIGQGVWIGWQMEFETDPSHRIKGTEDIYLNTGVSALMLAVLLALLQTVLELRRDPRSFLMHRGISATRIYFGKVIAGLTMYAAVLLVPALIAFGTCWLSSPESQPASWQQLIPVLSCITGAFSLYFATLIAIVWNGPWFVSRAVPLVTAFGVSITGIAILTEISEYGTLGGYLIVVLGNLLLLAAAWGVFVRNGEAAGRPTLGTVCLAASLLGPISVGFLLLFCLVLTTFSTLLQDRGIMYSKRTEYRVRRDGHVLKLDVDPYTVGNSDTRTVQGVTDLDDLNSTLNADYVGKTMQSLNRRDFAPQFLEMVTIWQPQDSWFQKPRSQRIRIQKSIETRSHRGDPRFDSTSPLSPQRGDEVHWIASRPDGWLYVYRVRSRRRIDLWYAKESELIAVVGPDGFTSPAERPQRRFDKILATTTFAGMGPYSAWRESQGRWENQQRFFLLSESGVYLIDPEAQLVKQVFAAPDGKHIRGLTCENDSIAILYDDSVDVHVAMAIPPRVESAGWTPPNVKVPGELRYSFPIPRQFARSPRFGFARVPGTDEVMLSAFEMYPTWISGRIMRMKLDGTAVRFHEYQQTDSTMLVPFLVAMPLLPMAPMLLIAAGDAAVSTVNSAPPGVTFGFIRVFPGTAALAILNMLIVSSGCWFLARRVAQRSGFDAKTKRNWLIWSFLIGPAGLVMLWFLRDWPAKDTCSSCSRERPVDCEVCPHCHAPVPAPELKGTEIFAVDSVPVLQLQQK